MNKSDWDEIRDFKMRSEFDRFVEWIGDQQKNGVVEEIPAANPYFRSLPEKWYRHLESGEIWRLVWPDYTFMGVFERVKLPEPPANSKKPAP